MEQQHTLFGEGHRPPHARGSDTSEAAAEAVRPKAGTLRARILVHIRDSGGATCSEVEDALDLKHQTASARIWELKGGPTKNPLPVLIRDSGQRRMRQTVWEVA